MSIYKILQDKRDGKELTSEEIFFFINGVISGEIPDYQVSALLMAIYLNGMNDTETVALTLAMAESGDIIDLSSIPGIKVDKHSTGGVGDKLSLIIIPLVASTGVPIAKMSGRGLGHTGGTIDKLEAIEGFRTELSRDEFLHNVSTYKMAIAGQTANLAPADKKLYSLRDVTATVDSIPLIASSIMSKKIASGADAIVLDVKVGSGAFMKSITKAEELANTMVNIGKSLGKKVIAVITDMNQPLGYEVGNANEIREVIQVLKGNGSEDETTIALTIAAHMTVLGGAFKDFDTAYSRLSDSILSGKALEKFKELVKIQGGNTDIIDNPDLLSEANYNIDIKANRSGYINFINAEVIGMSAMLLGAGRQRKEDKIDHAAGITLLSRVGDKVKEGDTICILHTNLEDFVEAESLAMVSFTIEKFEPEFRKLIYKVIK